MALLVDLALAVLFATALFLALWAVALWAVAPPGTPATRLRLLGQELVDAVRPGVTAAVLAVAISLLGVLGWVTVVGDADLPAFVINREGTVPAFFTSGLILVAGAVSLLLGEADRPGRRWWTIWGIVLIYLGIDEAAELHERVEVRLGLPGPIVLGPVAIVAAIAYLNTLSATPAGSRARHLYLAGAAAWATALLSDIVHGVDWKSVLEELLEMSGAALILLALLLIARLR